MKNKAITSSHALLKALGAMYPHAHIALRYSNPWELLVSVMLSAQCTDKKVNEVTEKLFGKYKTIQAYADAPVKALEQDIHSTGFYRNKAKNIKKAACMMIERYNGTIPHTMKEMLEIPGVARKTAHVVLSNAYGVIEGIAVDTHVARISQRLRLVPVDAIGGKKIIFARRVLARSQGHSLRVVDYIKDADPVKIEKQLMNILPKRDWFRVTYLLIDHGRGVCRAVNPRCAECGLLGLCPSARTPSLTLAQS